VQSSDGTYSLGNHTMDNFAVALSRPPGTNVQVIVNIQPPKGLVAADGRGGVPRAGPWRDITVETQVVALTNVVAGHFTLTLGADDDGDHQLGRDGSGRADRARARSRASARGNVAVTQTGTVYTITVRRLASGERSRS
jgi:hypothetical protein